MPKVITRIRSLFRFPRDIWLTIVGTALGAIAGWAVSHAYYNKSLADLKVDAEERKRVDELIFRGIESIGTIQYHRDPTGRPVGVTINLKAAASANATSTGTLGDTKPESK